MSKVNTTEFEFFSGKKKSISLGSLSDFNLSQQITPTANGQFEFSSGDSASEDSVRISQESQNSHHC